jgi:hypothetical protein
MEIKTTKEIINNELGVILNSVDYDVNNVLFEINKNKKWVSVDDIEKLDIYRELCNLIGKDKVWSLNVDDLCYEIEQLLIRKLEL